ncbi:MAG: hypothetical protein HRT46_11885, partial [Deltaproteobacteria bacterium]|nr:hypothetical protein [Deltaproteobacteria bacterium]
IELSKAVYEATSADVGQSGSDDDGDGGAKPADDVIDAEYEVKEDK